ncbi:tRNA (guanine(37)-N1)-methyltransferase isoform X2 [Pimephales promelas]|uniref:tRNA (guanine(37)-N1)-methyltransferase isoform X2 n=1 Tax=Pimephales promelas TaxID=90988 RepID=UPI0019555255|nr:tRNA (guanine(37)-N1)-methyltransferase isoform X2 [Pimephales promelas]KAG1950378.1 tRNA (guanine(37)-N1)-methyltransferase [Pimephales promelas]KAG1950379.1 tRNA (guanine(37)-N1)-methyltransferase [Pimephales promelas]
MTNRSGRLLFLVQKHHSCIFLPQNLNQFARISLQFSTAVHYQKAMPDQPQTSTDLGLYKPPPTVRGMTELDRAAFSVTVSVPAIRIPTNVLNKLVKSLKKVALQRPGLKRVVDEHKEDGNTDCSNGEHRLMLLDPNSITDLFGSEEAEALKAYGVPQEIQRYELKLTYENLKSEEILRAVLPEGQDVTSGFSRVGHIAHMNLRDHQLPYKKLIGQVIIDKNPGITCVVNKTNTIDSTYRNFQMEVLAGESNMVAKVRENGVFYEFDFSRVYWNPRLSTEHERIVALLQRGDTVVDVFAGVGPFAIPAARRGSEVLANDLNPDSFRWLQHNAKLNKVDRKITSFNMDGRDFIRGPVRERLPALMKESQKIHVVMNLPALAIEFLDAFRGLLDPEPDQSLSRQDDNLPQVHCYGFSKEDDAQRDVVERAEASLKISLQGQCSVHLVRNVAPNKEMMCVSFTLPREVLYSTHTQDRDSSEEPCPKKQKCEDLTD